MCSQLLRTCIGQVWMSVLGIIICKKKKEMEWRNSLYPPDPQLLVDLYCCQSRENSRKRNRWKEETGGACNYKIPVRVQRQHSVLDRHSISFSISIVLIHIAYTRIVMCLEGGHTLPTSTSRKQWVSSFGISCSLSCDKCRGLNGLNFFKIPWVCALIGSVSTTSTCLCMKGFGIFVLTGSHVPLPTRSQSVARLLLSSYVC